MNEEDDELESVHISEATKRKKNADAAKKKPLYDVYLRHKITTPKIFDLLDMEIPQKRKELHNTNIQVLYAHLA
jgi:hypothetical protein